MTTTIRGELLHRPGGWGADTICAYFGIDPDLPAEWATERRCRTWLRAHGYTVDVGGNWSDERCLVKLIPVGKKVLEFLGADSHAALLVACKAVEEAQP